MANFDPIPGLTARQRLTAQTTGQGVAPLPWQLVKPAGSAGVMASFNQSFGGYGKYLPYLIAVGVAVYLIKRGRRKKIRKRR